MTPPFCPLHSPPVCCLPPLRAIQTGRQDNLYTVNSSSSARAARPGGAAGAARALRCRPARSAGAPPCTLSRSCCRAERMRRWATSAVPLTLVCSGGREAVGMLSTPQEEVIDMSFTVCIFNICRVVLRPPALELVCMMSVCQRPFRVCSDIL